MLGISILEILKEDINNARCVEKLSKILVTKKCIVINAL